MSPASKHLYLLGNPVEHSISPQMQNAALKFMGIDADYRAVLVKDDADLFQKIKEFRSNDVIGFNVTVPFKEKVMRLLDSVDPSSKIIGAVNTVRNEKGILSGSNTDTLGFIDSLKSDGCFDAKGKTCVILGAGGASRALIFGLNYEKAKKISVYDIDAEKASDLISEISKYFKNVEQLADREALKKEIGKADLLVNATPVGMFPKTDLCPVDESFPIRKGLFVYDLVYNPPETKLVKLARAKGAKAVTGLGMLVRQGAASLEIWTGRKVPVDIMMAAAKKALGC